MISFAKYLTELRDSLLPIDETEALHLNLTEELLLNSKIAAYSVGLTLPDEEHPGKEIPVNPKRFPTKAIDILIPYLNGIDIEIFFDPRVKQWDSDIKTDALHVKLSPEQFGQFFNSDFYNKLLLKFQNHWPLKDKFFGELYLGLQEKEMKVGPTEELNEDGVEANDKSLANRDVDGDGLRDFTASGRKIVHFSDSNVSSKDAKFFCWPDLKKLEKWSTWKDWKKIHPLCRMRFKHGDKWYGLTLSTIKDDYDLKYRGFRGYDLTTLPPVLWLTCEENEALIRLSIVEKFIKHCTLKLSEYVNKNPEDIVKTVNSPDRLSIEEVKLTLLHVRKTLFIVKNRLLDTFKWK